MNESDEAFAAWMQSEYPDIWETRTKSPYTLGAFILAKHAWKAACLYQQDKTRQLNLFEDVV